MNELYPAMPIRGINVCEALVRHTPQQVERLLDRIGEWGMNTLVVHPAYGYRRYEPMIRQRCSAMGVDIVHYLYTSLAFLPGAPSSCFARDLEGRPRTPELACETHPCSADPQGLRWFRDGARRYFDQHTQPGDHVLLATADGRLHCQCPICRSRSAVEQWQPLLEIAVEEARRSGRDLKIHFISYVNRFAPPRDMAIFSQIDAMMFDVHLRFRWRAMDEDHPRTGVEDFELPADPRVAQVPINRYLLDRLIEWRSRFAGRIYVHENLMLQATMSLPQPNTGSLLCDIEVYRRIGLDGVVYEAFEPGMQSFAEQIGTLARALRGDAVSHTSGELELACVRELELQARAWPYLTTHQFDGLAMLERFMPDPAMLEHARRMRRYMLDRTLAHWQSVVGYAMEHADRLDWLYIPFTLMKWMPPTNKPVVSDPLARRFLTITKLWDFMEPLDDPIGQTRQVLQLLLSTPSPQGNQVAGRA